MKDESSGNPNEVAAVLTEYDCGFMEGVGVRLTVRASDLQAKIDGLEARNFRLKAQLGFTCVAFGLYLLVPLVLWVLR